jgi:hypothetical protein
MKSSIADLAGSCFHAVGSNVHRTASWLARIGMLILLGLVAGRASAQTIDRMTVSTFGGYAAGHSASAQDLVVLGEPQTYYLSDATTWASGAGGFSNDTAGVAGQTITGGTISYALDLAPGETDLMNYTDYDGGSHSSSGILAPDGPLVLVATIGSKTAVLNGYAQIVSDTPANYQPPRFVYYNAPVGDAVPFTVTYTLQGTPTWGSGIFATDFSYTVQGTIDFTHPLPEPSAIAMLGVGAIGLAAYALRRRKHAAIMKKVLL